MPDKKLTDIEIILERCKTCRGKVFKVFNDWEWRTFKFHCTITCQYCFRTAHGFGLTKRKAYNNAMKEWRVNNAK